MPWVSGSGWRSSKLGSIGPSVREQRGKPRTGRKRGGQPGHEPHQRTLLPAEKVSRIVNLRPPKRCKRGGRLRPCDTDPRRHQVMEIPIVQPDVTEYRMHGGVCDCCEGVTYAKLPEGVPAHMFGPRLLATIAILVGAVRTSRRNARMLLRELFNVDVSLGALSEAEDRVSAALEPAVDHAVEFATAQSVKNVDGSTWRLAGEFRAVWTIATRLVTVFVITADATRETVRQLLGAARGFIISDRGAQFAFWAMERRQVCWAHLIRKFVAFSERTDAGAKIGEHLLLFARAMLSYWYRVRDGTMSRRTFARRMRLVEVAIVNTIAQGAELRLRGLSGSCEEILDHRDALFTFVREDGIEPTNNAAERALRPLVLWRKTSYGSQSERGCLFAQRVMTVVRTLEQQKRHLLSFLVETIQAAQTGGSTPSLLPVTP